MPWPRRFKLRVGPGERKVIGNLAEVNPADQITGRDLIRRGPFARLWWANSISSLGDWVTLFATFSLAAKISGGGTAASVAILVPLVARILPGLLIGVVGGVLADRWDRKKTMIVADFGRAVLVASLILVTNFRQLFALTFVIEVLSLLRQPAREAVVPTLIPRAQLMAANGLNLVSAYGTAPVGSALFAGIAQVATALFPGFGAFGPAVATAFIFDATTFLVSGLITVTIPIDPVPVTEERKARSRLDLRAPARDLAEGFRLVTRAGAVRRMVVGMAAGLFGGGALFVLGQPFSEQVLGASDTGYGILVTALGVGVGLGMGAVTVFGRVVVRREVWFGAALGVTGLAIVFTALSTHVAAAASWTFVAGVGTGVAYVTGFTHLHSVVTDEIRGRAFAALFAAARAALLVSFGLAGIGAVALDGLMPGRLGSGIRAVMTVGGVVIVSSGLATLWAVRSQFRPGPIDEETLETLREAGDAITWMRGHRGQGE